MTRSLNNSLGYFRQTREPEKPTIEQIREVVELAEQFDKLQAMPGWEKALRYMGEKVNAELSLATAHQYEPERMRVGVLCWNAKRELLDSLLGWMEQQQSERDRIVAEVRENRGA